MRKQACEDQDCQSRHYHQLDSLRTQHGTMQAIRNLQPVCKFPAMSCVHKLFRAAMATQTPGRIPKVDPHEGSSIYTIGVFQSRTGGSTFWILPGVWPNSRRSRFACLWARVVEVVVQHAEHDQRLGSESLNFGPHEAAGGRIMMPCGWYWGYKSREYPK